ncbi:MAG: hypothetical protein Q9204_003263 [Flavoplaca sp. TL-2023a]
MPLLWNITRTSEGEPALLAVGTVFSLIERLDMLARMSNLLQCQTVSHHHRGTRSLVSIQLAQKTQLFRRNQDKFQQAAYKFVAMIITQTYSYLVRSGISHGAIITGKAMIFLLVKEQEPHMVYFYYGDPKAEVDYELNIGQSFPHECTAVAQLTTFCLLAHEADEYPQSWREKVDKEGPRWRFAKRETERDIPLKVEEYQERPPSAYKSRRDIALMYQTPAASSNLSTPAKPGCKPTSSAIQKDSDDNDDADSGFDPHETPTKNPSSSLQGKLRENKQQPPPPPPPPASRGTTQKYAYCSHACLKGLVDRSALDTGCPNFELHPQHHSSNKHALTRPLLARLLRRQLAVDLDTHCTNLREQGRTGMLFKLTLSSHGYTFVAKGVPRGFVTSAKHEGRVYSLMRERQGQSIPVYLGNIDLIKKWIEGTFDVVHMLLLSWAGESVARNIALDAAGRHLVMHERSAFERQCMLIGIHHQDTEYRNILWNKENKQLMFIDFDMTVVFDLRRPPPDTVKSMRYADVFGSSRRTAAIEHKANIGQIPLARWKGSVPLHKDVATHPPAARYLEGPEDIVTISSKAKILRSPKIKQAPKRRSREPNHRSCSHTEYMPSQITANGSTKKYFQQAPHKSGRGTDEENKENDPVDTSSLGLDF